MGVARHVTRRFDGTTSPLSLCPRGHLALTRVPDLTICLGSKVTPAPTAPHRVVADPRPLLISSSAACCFAAAFSPSAASLSGSEGSERGRTWLENTSSTRCLCIDGPRRGPLPQLEIRQLLGSGCGPRVGGKCQ
uniref:Uncharacterized protein n=1 Tax=Knipowitschia caucasica TaxID=637954 RepID=A0AAV2KRL1_KNICA